MSVESPVAVVAPPDGQITSDLDRITASLLALGAIPLAQFSVNHGREYVRFQAPQFLDTDKTTEKVGWDTNERSKANRELPRQVA